jgi:citrate synthase
MLKDQPATAAEIGALDTYFTTVCENGLGSASFVARVTASTKASLPSAVLIAYCAFTGPLNGGERRNHNAHNDRHQIAAQRRTRWAA